MKIGILVTDFPPHVRGGAETQAELLAKHLSKNHDVLVFTRKYKETKNYEKRDGYTVVRIPYIDFPLLRFVSYCLSAYYRVWVERSRIDILQTYMLTPNGFIGNYVKRYLKIPIVSGIRGGDWYFSRNNFFPRFFVKKALFGSSLVFAQTKIMADEVRKEYPSVKIEVVPNMVEKGTANNEKKEYDVIFVGNLMKRKGVDNLISAAGDINGKVMIVGNGYERERLEKMVYDLDLKGRVVLKGKVDRSEILKEISKAKVLVLPSVSGEGMPNVILEAYSCGVPVVASSIAGIPDIVVDGKTGYLAKPGDVSELAEKINHLLEDDRYQLMKGNCIKFASKYYPEKIVPKIEKIYKRFL